MDLNAAGGQPITVVFNIVPPETKTIQLSSALPTILKSVTINSTGVTGIVIDGSAAGAFADGLKFSSPNANIANVSGLEIRNFSGRGIVIVPSNAAEQVNVNTCYIHNCSMGGIVIGNGANHSIVGCRLENSTAGWGLCINSPAVDGVRMIGGVVKGNSVGGIRFLGDEHLVNGCNVVLNGSAEVGDHRGGVVFGSSTTSSTVNRCGVVNCTLARNTPWGAKRLFGFDNQMTGNETYLNTQLGYKVLAPQGGISLKRFVVDTVHNQVIIGGTATSAANTQVRLEFFVPIQPPPDNQGGAYMDSADVNVTLDASGTKSFFHQFGAAIVFDGVGFDPPVPFAGNIDDTDSIVASTTANSTNSTGTSEFSQPSTATLPGDFDLDGYVAGSDFMIWQQNVGKINPKYWEGDADFDGDVDSVDLDIWGENFGEVP